MCYQELAEFVGSKNRLSVTGYTYAVSERKDLAREVLNDLLKRSKETYISPYQVAVIYAGLGEKDEAFIWLNKACDEHSLIPGPIRNDPRLDSLRDDPRYKDLLRRIGLPL